MHLIPFVFVQIAWTLWVLFSYIWLHPFSVHVFQTILDASNFSAWQITGESRLLYNYADRSTDLLYYLVSLAYATYFFRELWYLKWVIPFLVIRIIGNAAYLPTLEESLLVFFPNVFGLLFTIYTALDLLKLDHHLRKRLWLNLLLIIASVAIKIYTEIHLHVVRKVDSEPRDPDFPNIWNLFELRLDCLLVLLLFVVYVGMTSFPNFEPGTVQRDEVLLFFAKTGRFRGGASTLRTRRKLRDIE